MNKIAALAITAAAATATVLAWRAVVASNVSTTQRIDSATIKRLKKFSESVESSRTSALAAFAATGDDEHGSLDERAMSDIKRVGEVFAEVCDDLPAVAIDLAKEIVERYEAAQMQLMSFAINRKNRELDGAQTEMEMADRSAFARESTTLSERLIEAIKTGRI